MGGQNIARLRTTVAGMSETAVQDSQQEWDRGHEALSDMVEVLQQSGTDIRDAFGAKSEIGNAARAVLEEIRGHLEKRRDRMKVASDTLGTVAQVMHRAVVEQHDMPTSGPGDPPTMEGGPYADETDEIQAMKIYAAKTRTHNQQVEAFNAADERARQQVEQVNETFQRAGDVFATMWEPEVEGPGTGAGGGGGGGGGHVRGPGLNPIHHDEGEGTTGTDSGEGTDDGTDGTDDGHPDDTGNGDPDDLGLDGDPGDPGDGGPEGNDPGDDPRIDDGPGGGGGIHGGGSNGLLGGSSLSGVAGGGAAAVLGGAGLRGLLGGGGATPSVPGQSVARPIGSSGRRGAGGVLGNGRPGSGGGAGGGRRGGKGAPGVGGRRGGRRKDDERDDQRESYEIEDEWTDDEGQYPGVIQ